MSNFRPPRDAGADRRLAADLLRPAVPPRRAQAAAARVHQDRGGQAGAGDQGVLPLAHRRVRGTATSSTPPASTRSTSRSGSSPTCSASRPRTGRSSASSSRTRSKASTCRRKSASSGCSSCSTTCSRRSTITSTTRARTSPRYLINAELYGSKLEAVARRRHDGAAAHRGHRHDVERDRRLVVAPGARRRPTASGSSPSPRCCRPRWRSSCAPTRRSPWRGW